LSRPETEEETGAVNVRRTDRSQPDEREMPQMGEENFQIGERKGRSMRKSR
jgi:hypothetical protein